MSSRSLYDKLSLSVVQVVVRSRAPRTFQPWDFKFQEGASASACVVEGQRVLTCAHVVAHAVHLHVLRPGDARIYRASVAALDHDRELALLSVEDPRFFDGMVPVELGEVPNQQDVISVWGYPTRASTLSTTMGVVSRIEVIASSHSHRAMLALQTDATVTFGNSGGPVFHDDRMVGVVLQGSGAEESEKTHIVPAPVIESFFEDLADGVVSGLPDLGVCWQKIDNEDLKASLGLEADDGGVLVTAIVPGASASDIVQVGDVITMVDGEPLSGDGTVLLRERLRVDFSAIVGKRQVGDTITLEVVRQHVRMKLEVVLGPYVALVRPGSSGESERYFIYGGLVFQPLTFDYIQVWQDRVDARLVGYAKFGLPSDVRVEVVVLSQVLAHALNIGYHEASMLVVSRINGLAIRHLGDVPVAFDVPVGGFHVVEVEGLGRRDVTSPQEFGTRLVLDAAKARRAHPEILAQHGIASDRSSKLAP